MHLVHPPANVCKFNDKTQSTMGRRTISGPTDKTGRRSSGLLTALLLISAAALPGSAFAVTAEDLFADGNRLFRDDLYWAALLRYREAQDAGMNTPLLHYNMGVAHYKASQHIRAREALLQAARTPALEVHAHYNLGLNSWALGDADEALRWFRQARDQERFPQISALATKAIARIERERAAKQKPVLVRAELARKEKRPLGEFDFRFSAGGGNDDNVFRSPAES
jgi:tetratricopeptide (TPR) repeat protein